MPASHISTKPLRIARFALATLLVAAIQNPAAWGQAQASISRATGPASHLLIDPDLDAGFRLLYQLEFARAGERFSGWERQHPAEPLGPALEAAAYLYEEFYRKGVMTSDFFLDDNRLLGGIADKPDADIEVQFAAAVQRAEQRAHERLARYPRDPNALFALTLTAGMSADNSFVIEKRQIESLRLLRDADRDARALLNVAPDASDAYLALGASNYIIGCLPAYKRAFLRVGGIHGDKVLGMQQLALAASNGHYLRPYAKLMLALAALREKDTNLARSELADLAAEFPKNVLFGRELAKVPPSIIRGSFPDAP